MKKMPRGEELSDLLDEYGISQHNQAHPNTGNDDAELQHRLTEFLNFRRADRMWVVALISAIASVVSAVAAWVAVSGCHH